MPPTVNTPPTAASRREILRRVAVLAAGAGASALAAGISRPAHADTIAVKSAEVRPEEDGYVLNADFDLTLNTTLEEALQRGVPLYFILQFELYRPRWYWLDEKI